MKCWYCDDVAQAVCKKCGKAICERHTCECGDLNIATCPECEKYFQREWNWRIEEVKKLLKEISEGKGAYSRDHLTHAENCIKSMKKLVKEALLLLENFEE